LGTAFGDSGIEDVGAAIDVLTETCAAGFCEVGTLQISQAIAPSTAPDITNTASDISLFTLTNLRISTPNSDHEIAMKIRPPIGVSIQGSGKAK